MYEWMVHVTTVDSETEKRYEFRSYFDTREKADAYAYTFVSMAVDKNVIIRILKVEKGAS